MTATRGFNLSLPLVQEQRTGWEGRGKTESCFFFKIFFSIYSKFRMFKAQFPSGPGCYININADQSSIKFQQLFITSDLL